MEEAGDHGGRNVSWHFKWVVRETPPPKRSHLRTVASPGGAKGERVPGQGTVEAKAGGLGRVSAPLGQAPRGQSSLGGAPSA